MIARGRDEGRQLLLESRRSLVVSYIEIIRTERRRRYSDAEKAALLAEVDRGGCTVAEVVVQRIAEGHPANRIAELMPWVWVPQASKNASSIRADVECMTTR
jgi:transposase-like protein